MPWRHPGASTRICLDGLATTDTDGWLWLGFAGVLLLPAGITCLPFFNAVFPAEPIGWDQWLRLLGAARATLLLVETHKWRLAQINPRETALSGRDSQCRSA